ncbi:uncharacterized protein (DUF2336 family) [Roseibium hamelinense]|uniref:Uncharacterized protein (DUF2336 family) n=1 Tax=Roseibium hamelinense TaxID=150831 RepID=A0A562TAT4_9HYPH|nr:DUF2336 domain-containing protein [Roseibium hamelinense]MTI42230.1 DUF2336 domain-containing protein [Roseibium hamelinense]TWI90553.1 uncharacterized protein (DUF2336 family) [Roseibium hamelinense]
MIIQDFLNWVSTAPDGPRAEAAGALARAWLYSNLSDDDRQGAGAALIYLLDDPVVAVRQALADSLSGSPDAPVHLILALSQDVDEVAETVFARSPLIGDCELVDAVASASERIQIAIAGRQDLSPTVAAAVSEVGLPSACAALLKNHEQTLLASTFHRINQRFSDVCEVRDLMLDRRDLPIPLRHALLKQIADGLIDHPFVLESVPAHARSHFLLDATDKVTLRLASEATGEGLTDLTAYLRETGQINTRLLLRAVCTGRLRFFVCSLSLLGNIPEARLRDILASVRRPALQAVLRKAGLPARSHEAFMVAVDIARSGDVDFCEDLPIALARTLTEAVMSVLQDEALGGTDSDIMAFIRRFAVDVARTEARAYVSGALQKQLAAA